MSAKKKKAPLVHHLTDVDFVAPSLPLSTLPLFSSKTNLAVDHDDLIGRRRRWLGGCVFCVE